MGRLWGGAAPAFFLVAACVVSCGSDDSAGGPSDSGAIDSGAPDAGLPDAGPRDAGCAAPRVVCGGACVDTETDVNNCGTCGHTCGCGSTSCTAGVCDPAVLADKQGGPYALTLAGGYLYWGADADMTLSRVPAAGGSAKVLFPNRTLIRGIAANTANLFFTRNAFNIVESGGIDGTGGGNWTNSQESGAYGMVIDDAHAYWADNNTGLIRTAPLTVPRSTASTILGGQDHPANLVIDGTYIYWITNVANGTVMRMSKTGGASTATPLATNQATPSGLAVDAHDVYWTNDGDGTVKSVPIAGGTITPLATGRNAPRSVAVDDQFVYWTELAGGTVEKVPLSGGTPQPIARNQNGPLGLALDASCVYFTVYANNTAGAGSIRKTSK